MGMLISSILAMAVGPLLLAMAAGSKRVLAALDAFVLVTLSGLVLIHIVPQSVAIAGGAALGAALFGMVGLVMLEWGSDRLAARIWRTAVPVLLLGLAIHAFLDGVGLANRGDGHGRPVPVLGLAVILHRIPVGLALWWGARQRYGARAALGLMAIIIVFTAIGSSYGEELMKQLPPAPLALLQALIGGALLHGVVGHPMTPSTPETRVETPRWEAMGGLVGLGLLFALSAMDSHGHGGQGPGAGAVMLSLVLTSAPYLLMGALLQVGLTRLWRRWAGHGRPMAVGSEAGIRPVLVQGVLDASLNPVGPRGGVTDYRRLAGAQASVGTAWASLLAAPGLEPVALVLSLGLLGAPLALTRAAAALALTLVVGLVVARGMGWPTGVAAGTPGGLMATELPDVPSDFLSSLRQQVDESAGWILLGLALGAILAGLIPAQGLQAIPAWLGVVLATGLGLPFYLSATGCLPLVAVLVHKGLSLGAGVALSLVGPLLSLSMLKGVSNVQGRPAAGRLAGSVGLLALLVGLLVDWQLPQAPLPALMLGAEPTVHWMEWLCTGLVTLLFLDSLFRLGTRGMIAKVLGHAGEQLHTHELGFGHEHGHEHGQGHEHAHPHAHGHTHSDGHDHAHAHTHASNSTRHD